MLFRSLLICVIFSTTCLFAQEEVGSASFYNNRFHGNKTASGERYNKNLLTCAHPSYPFGTKLKITNQHNGKEVYVKVNDRGPFKSKRIIDLSYLAAKELDIIRRGIASVKVEVIRDFSDKKPPITPKLNFSWANIYRLTFRIPDKLVR